MAYAKYDVKSQEWWKHLKENKRRFWKKVRKLVKQELTEHKQIPPPYIYEK